MLEFRKVQKRIWGGDLSDLEPNGYRASERGIAGHLVIPPFLAAARSRVG